MRELAMAWIVMVYCGIGLGLYFSIQYPCKPETNGIVIMVVAWPIIVVTALTAAVVWPENKPKPPHEECKP